MRNILVLLAVLVVLLELYRLLCGYWLRHFLEIKKKAERTRKPLALRLKSERDYSLCREDKGKRATSQQNMPIAW